MLGAGAGPHVVLAQQLKGGQQVEDEDRSPGKEEEKHDQD